MRESQSEQANDNSLGRALVRQVEQLGASLRPRPAARAIASDPSRPISVSPTSSPSPEISPVGTRPVG